MTARVTVRAYAWALAHSLLAETLPQRWAHVEAVAAEAERLARILPASERHVLICAAWLHDVGYAPTVPATGLHSLDGARFLRHLGVPDRICALVARHSSACTEAALRGVERIDIEFPAEESATSDLLWFCDLTIGHDGRRTTLETRLAEIGGRYGPDDVVTQAMRLARPALEAAVERTRRRIAACDSVDPRGIVVQQSAVDAASGVGMDLQVVQALGIDPGDLA